jgi:hypothetical protein
MTINYNLRGHRIAMINRCSRDFVAKGRFGPQAIAGDGYKKT